MVRTELEIINKLGLHARAAAKFVSTASAFASDIRVGREDRLVDGKSIMSVMMLAAGKGTTLRLEVDGRDEGAAARALADLVARRFDEDE